MLKNYICLLCCTYCFACNNAEDITCTIDHISANVHIKNTETILAGIPYGIPVTFELIYSVPNNENHNCLSKTNDFDCLIKIENIDSGQLFRGTFLVDGFDGQSNTFTKKYYVDFGQLGTGHFRIIVCADVSNNIIELTEHACE